MKDQRWKKLNAILDEAEVYGRALGKVDFDLQCVAPPEGRERAGLDEAVLSQHLHGLFHSKKYFKLICSLHDDPGRLTSVQRRVVRLNWLLLLVSWAMRERYKLLNGAISAFISSERR